VREDPLLHPDQVDGAELEALGIVEGHQGDEAFLAADGVLVGEERDLLQEVRQRGLLRRLLVLAGDTDELLQVLEPSERLDGALRLERFEIAAALERALEELRDGKLERAGLQ